MQNDLFVVVFVTKPTLKSLKTFEQRSRGPLKLMSTAVACLQKPVTTDSKMLNFLWT